MPRQCKQIFVLQDGHLGVNRSFEGGIHLAHDVFGQYQRLLAWIEYSADLVLYNSVCCRSRGICKLSLGSAG
jgi:hypothetical protein